MRDWQQRVIDEKTELCEKLAKLRLFGVSAEFAGLNPEDRRLLEHQGACMQDYADIIGKRIARFS